jgi:2,4-dienoyl-CoA reductase-like NADH-dependent reductase (Old Yellow Enzyme family)
MTVPVLFSPMRLGELVLPNRVTVSPMAQYSCVDGEPGVWHLQHLGALAVSGPGLLTLESTAVEQDGYGCSACLALHTDAQEAALRRLIDALRSISSTALGLQIGHSGRKASASLPQEGGGPLFVERGGWQTVAPHATSFGGEWPVPRMLDEEGIARVRAAFIGTARRAARLDLDLLELHGAHGYLLHSFLSPISNRRTDAYGGSFDNRLRLVREIVEDVRLLWPRSRALGIRLNARDWVNGGLEPEDTVRIAGALKEVGCDFVCISAGAISAEARIPAAPGYLVPYAARVRTSAGIATLVTGLIHEPHQAEAIVASGQADGLAVARAFLDNPRWVWEAAKILGHRIEYPMQYSRSHPDRWKPQAIQVGAPRSKIG